ncbi:RHS repeat protein [Polaromonas sp. SP1]|nr:RHS repeat protein [Polaromonas sp. SP1]QGJ20847.1 hypothetical protein F7R28_13775 [Polaromonas sp. Pch-P]
MLYKHLDDDSLWQFDPAGKLLTVTQRNGWITTYTYSTVSTPPATAPTAGLLLTVSNHFGRTLGFRYNASGQLISTTSPDARVTSYGYDSTSATGRLVTVSYPGITGGVASKTYLYENATFPQLLTGVIDEKGVRLATYAYDGQGRGISTQHAGGGRSAHHQLRHRRGYRDRPPGHAAHLHLRHRQGPTCRHRCRQAWRHRKRLGSQPGARHPWLCDAGDRLSGHQHHVHLGHQPAAALDSYQSRRLARSANDHNPVACHLQAACAGH